LQFHGALFLKKSGGTMRVERPCRQQVSATRIEYRCGLVERFFRLRGKTVAPSGSGEENPSEGMQVGPT
jgi:hypothetical protein